MKTGLAAAGTPALQCGDKNGSKRGWGKAFLEVCAGHEFLYAQMYAPSMVRRLEMTREIVVFGCGGGMVLRLTGVGGSLRIQVAL